MLLPISHLCSQRNSIYHVSAALAYLRAAHARRARDSALLLALGWLLAGGAVIERDAHSAAAMRLYSQKLCILVKDGYESAAYAQLLDCRAHTPTPSLLRLINVVQP